MALPLTIALVAGEASGDLLGAHLIDALKIRYPEARFIGIGGPKMIEAGLTAWWPQEKLAVRGYVEVLKHLPEILSIRRTLKRRLLLQRPNVFIGIDAPDFNLKLERSLKRAGIPTIHYVSPSIWAWRPGRIRFIKQAVSHVLALFPFEPEIYRAANVPVSYVGHPLADILPLVPNREEMREQMRIESDRPVFAFLPGSRQSEVAQHAALYVATAKKVLLDLPTALFLVPLMTRETRNLFESALFKAAIEADADETLPPDPVTTAGLPIKLLYGHAVDAMIAADGVLVASGTATLEAALLKRPMVITYRMPTLSWWMMKRKMLQPYVGLPNILCQAFVVPELLQKAATPEALASALVAQYNDKDGKSLLEGKFLALHHLLRQGTSQKAADAIAGVLGR